MTPSARRRRHAQIDLPPLSASEALIAVAILERTVTAIWRAHGDAMADELALRRVETRPPPGAIPAGNPDVDPDVDF